MTKMISTLVFGTTTPSWTEPVLAGLIPVQVSKLVSVRDVFSAPQAELVLTQLTSIGPGLGPLSGTGQRFCVEGPWCGAPGGEGVWGECAEKGSLPAAGHAHAVPDRIDRFLRCDAVAVLPSGRVDWDSRRH